MIYTYELHGGNHDGLILTSGALHPRMVFPCEEVLTAAQYHSWQPKAGMNVAVYRCREARTDPIQRLPVQHMYLEDTYLLADRNP